MTFLDLGNGHVYSARGSTVDAAGLVNALDGLQDVDREGIAEEDDEGVAGADRPGSATWIVSPF